MTDELPVHLFHSPEEFEAWLEAHHESADGLWLKLAKKNAPHESISRGDALELALCFGWIDSQARTINDHFWMQRFTRRRSRSKWSKINCKMANRLIEEGRMRPAGLKQVKAAKHDGRWDRAYDSPSTIAVPDDLQQALDANPTAKAFFDQLDSRNRYAILYRIHDAKRDDTRARRIDTFVAMLNEEKTIY